MQPASPLPAADVVRTRGLVQSCVLFTLVASLVVMAGWAFDIPVLRRLLPDQISMAPLTALSFFGSTAALWLLHDAEIPTWRRRVGQCFALVVTAVGALVLVEYLTGTAVGIDGFLFPGPLQKEGFLPLGRPSPTAAFSFLAVGVALLTIDMKLADAVVFLLLVPMFLASIALIGYASRSSPLYRILNLTPIAFPTAFVFAVLEIGILATRPRHAIVRLITFRQPGSKMARRLLPAAIFVLLVLGWLRLFADREGWLSGEASAAVSIAADVAILGGLILWQAHVLNRQELQRQALAHDLDNERVLLSTLMNSLPDLVFVKDRDGRFLLANQALATLAGASDPSELVGKSDLDISPREIAEQYVHDDLRVLETRQSQLNTEERSQGRDGVPRWLLTTKVPLIDRSGSVFGLVGISRDITDRKRAEDRLRDVVEEAPVGMILVNAHGEILLVNAQAERLFGYARSDLLGRSVEKLVPERFRQRHPGNRNGYFADPRPRPPGKGRDDLYGLHRDGHEFPVDIGLSRVETANEMLVMASIIDITERKAVETALRLSEEKFSLAFANSPAAITLSRLDDGTVLDVNETWLRLTGYARGEVIGRSVRSGIRFWPNAEAAEQFARELKQNDSLHGWEQKFYKKSGDQFVAQFSAQVMTVQNEKLILTTVTDITERRALEERMQQTQKLESIGILAAGLAHDFNNILQAILGNAEIAAVKTPPDSPAVKNLQ
ncbi:MAG TPA: PAS domain S-box protein, partial [Spirochaetia bacterium]|nr:PAS domain S-box protein [Spirochaetia bacterium]